MSRYDSLINQISNYIIQVIKQPTQVFLEPDNLKLSKYESPEFSILDKNKLAIINFEVHVYVLRYKNPKDITDTSPEWSGVYMDGFADFSNDDQDVVLGLKFLIDPIDEPVCYSKLIVDIKEFLRHEIEHLTHSKDFTKLYRVGNKKLFNNDYNRRQAIKQSNQYYQYYLLPKEIDANIHGVYKRAKILKMEYKEALDQWLDLQVLKGFIEQRHKRIIYQKMKKRAKQIGGLPTL